MHVNAGKWAKFFKRHWITKKKKNSDTMSKKKKNMRTHTSHTNKKENNIGNEINANWI